MEIVTGMAYALQRPIHVVSGLGSMAALKNRIYNPLESELEAVVIGFVKLSENFAVPNHFIALLNDIALPQINASLGNADVSRKEIEIITLPEEDVEMLDAYESDESL